MADFLVLDPIPASWAISEDQQGLYATARRFAREQLEPLLTRSPDAAEWRQTVKRAAALDLGTMILPAHMGGMAITRGDLSGIIGQFAAGPLEQAAELSLSAAALMVLRAHDALGQLPARNIHDYFDGTTSIALSVPDVGTSCTWRLSLQTGSPGLIMLADTGHPRVVLATPPVGRGRTQHTRVTGLGALTLEQFRFDHTDEIAPLAILEQPDTHGIHPIQTWLTESALYLCALLAGAMHQSVVFALDYSAGRHAFRKPLASHQMVATRLADMLAATHATHVFLRSVTTADTSRCARLVRQLARHVSGEAIDTSRELVQLCGGHGYVEGLPPAARFQTVHWLALLLTRLDAALGGYIASQPSLADSGQYGARQ
jgi:alkylation response protein AidB-like acyl-CoA dehydrogenase